MKHVLGLGVNVRQVARRLFFRSPTVAGLVRSKSASGLGREAKLRADSPLISFFMIVTPRDAVIADYAVKSYGKLRDIDFLLVVYANCLTANQQAFYFPRWRAFQFVQLMVSNYFPAEISQEDIDRCELEGPYEMGYMIWDRELKRLSGKFIATVDADFEILNPRFIYHVLTEMENDERIICFSTDAMDTSIVYDTYSEEWIRLNARNHTWFCVYRREAFRLSETSHKYFEEYIKESDARIRNAWDDGAAFQKVLRDMGYITLTTPAEFGKDYIHYGEFSKNIAVTRQNIVMYRILKKLRRSHLVSTLLCWRGFDQEVDSERHHYQKTTAIMW